MEWQAELKRNNRGRCRDKIQNSYIILNNDPIFRNCFGTEYYTHQKSLLSDLPWRKVEPGERWTRTDDRRLWEYLEKHYGLKRWLKIKDALVITFSENIVFKKMPECY